MKNPAGKTNLLKQICMMLVLLLCSLWGIALAGNEADGSKIESVTIKWLTPDSTADNLGNPYSDGNPDHLFIATDSDDELFMKYQVDVSLSGQNDYEPGTVKIMIPAQVWHARKYVPDGNGGVEGVTDDTKLIDMLELSVPEAPSEKSTFNWQQVGNEYVLTNTQTVGATSKVMFQFTIRGLTPHEIVDMSESEAVYAKAEVVTAKGNTISLDSEQTLTAQVDTIDRLPEDGAVKNGKLYTTASLSIPVGYTNNLPGGSSNSGNYVYVEWEVYVNHEGNQPFTLKMDDDFSAVTTDDGAGGRKPVQVTPVFLGSVPKADVSGSTFVYNPVGTPAYDDHTHDLLASKDHPITVWIAYSKDEMPPEMVNGNPRIYYIENTADWELTEADRKTGSDERMITKASRTAAVTYSPVDRGFDGGVSIVEKFTGDGESRQEEYEYALNLLKTGENADLLFCLDATNMSWNLTTPITWNDAENRPKNGEELAKTKRDDSTYGQLGWNFTVTDDKTFFNESLTPMTADDFTFSSVKLGEIEKFRFGPSPSYQIAWAITDDGSYRMRWVNRDEECYYTDDTLPTPDILFEIRLDGSDTWITAARAAYGTDGTGALTFTDLASGVTADAASGILQLPDNMTDFRYSVTSNCINKTFQDRSELAGMRVAVWPTVTVKPSDTVMTVVDAAMAAMDEPMVRLKNNTRMERSGWIGTDGNGSAPELINEDNAWANLTAAGYGVYLTKEAAFDPDTDDDVENRTATIHYSGKLREMSNLKDMGNYLEAQTSGAIPAETAGIWYDLLPEGMNPILSSVRLGGSDQIISVYTVTGYKGSDRTLLVVEAELTPDPQLTDDANAKTVICDSHTVSFDAVISYDDIEAYGMEQKNYLAFESRTQDLADGRLGTVPGELGAPDCPDRSLNSHTPDMPDQIKTLMTGLNPDSDPSDARFVYAYDMTRMDVNLFALSGISKLVRDDLDGIWTQGLNGQKQATVYEGHDYSYRLKLSSSSETVTRDIFLFDTLENYHVASDTAKKADHDHIEARKEWKGDWNGMGQWRGTLNSIDLSEFIKAGAAPVLYISTVPDLQFADSNPGATQAEKDILFSTNEYDVTDTKYWTKVEPDAEGIWTVPADLLGKVTAFAADISKKTDGSEFLLNPGESATVYLHMTAPDDNMDENVWNAKGAYARDAADGPVDWEAAMDPANNMYAFNNTRLRCVQSKAGSSGSSTRTMIRNDYTRVGIIPAILRVTKVWEDDNDHDNTRPDGILVTLKRKQVGSRKTAETVTDAAGKPLQLLLNDTNDWTGLFRQIDIVDEDGNPWQYLFEETLPDGTPLGSGYELNWQKDSENAYILTNSRENEKVTVEGVKVWVGDEGALQKRPGQITLELYQDGIRIDQQTVMPDRKGNWIYSFGEQDKYKPYDPSKGVLEEYVYTVKEVPVDWYFCDDSDYTKLVNEYDPFGKLEIVKTVKETVKTGANDDAEFEFTVLLYREKTAEELTSGAPATPLDGTYDYHIEEMNGSDWVTVPGSGATVESGGIIKLKADQKAVIEGLPTASTYWVKEEPAPGFTQTRSENTNGKIPSRVAATASFENAYRASGSVQMYARKQLTGQALRNRQFKFEMLDETGKVVATAYSEEPSNSQPGGTGNPIIGMADIPFSMLKYTEEDIGKTYTYTVKEVVPDPAAGGMTYDTDGITILVTVEDNGDGTLKVTAKDDKGISLNKPENHIIPNTYEADCSVELDLMKFLDGRTLQDQEFEFELYQCDKDGHELTGTGVLATKKNGPDGKVIFTAADTPALAFDQDDISLEYELTGDEKTVATYYFKVKEKKGPDVSVDYTTEEKLFTVKVFDKRDGTLGYTVGTQKIVTESNLCINCNGTGKWPAVVSLDTVLRGHNVNITSDERNAVLATNVIDLTSCPGRFNTGDYGIWSYDDFITNDNMQAILCPHCLGYGAVGDISHILDVTINADGSIPANPYGIELCPECGGSGINKNFATLQHQNSRWYSDYDLVGPCSVINDPNGTDNGYTCVAQIVPSGGGSYLLIMLRVAGYRHAGRAKYFNDVDCPFCGGTGGSSSRNISGDIDLPVLTNTLKPGLLYLTKQVEGENPDPDTEFTFTVTVSGGLDSVTYDSSKGVTGNVVPVTDDQFTVTLVQDETLTFTDLPLGTEFTVTEVTPLPSGWNLLNSEGTAGTTNAEEPTAAVFINVYGSTTGDLEIRKLTDEIHYPLSAKAAEREFTFEITLTDQKHAALTGTQTYDAEWNISGTSSAGTVTFTDGMAEVKLKVNDTLTVTGLPVGYTYTVKETGDLSGWTADKAEGTTGKILPGTTGNGTPQISTAEFTNLYKASGIVNVSVKKLLQDRDLKDGEFTFGLYAADENGNIVDPAPLDTVTNSAPGADGYGTGTFLPIKATEETTQYYVIQEIIPDPKDPTVRYSEEKILVTVQFADLDGKGKLSAGRYDGTDWIPGAVMTDPDHQPLEVLTNLALPGQIRLIKAVDGTLTDIAKGAEFTFNVSFTDRNGKPWTGSGTIHDSTGGSYTAVNGVFKVPVKAGSNVTLTDIPNGTGYTVQEAPASVPGWTLDPAVYTGTVTTAESGSDFESVTLNNRYDPRGEFTPRFMKLLYDHSLESVVEPQGGQFTFLLTDGNGKVLQTVTNDNSGNIVFDPLKFTAADIGTYEFYAEEKDQHEPGYTADTHRRKIVVTVKEDPSSAGGLAVTAEITDADTGSPDGADVFKNEFNPLSSIPVAKYWRKDADRIELRDSITLTLYSVDEAGEKTVAEVDTSAAGSCPNPWTITADEAKKQDELEGRWDGVQLFDENGNALSFLVEETGPAGVYLTFVSGYAEKGYAVYNRLVCDTMPLSVMKYIDQIGQIPAADEIFEFVLTDEDGNTVTVNNDTDGVADFGEILYVLKDVGTHTYTVREKQILNGIYMTDATEFTVTVTVTDNGDGTLSIEKAVFATDPEGNETELDPDEDPVFVNRTKTGLTVYKEWQGGEEDDITLILYANGKKLEETETVRDPETGEQVGKINYVLTRNGYTYTFSQLAPVDEKGEKIEYTVKEKGISGYMRIYSNVDEHKEVTDMLYDGGTVINRAVTSVKIRKVWEGLTDKDPKPPITLTLYCNDEATGRKPSGPDKNGWYTWNNLPRTRNGENAVYYVVEERVKGMRTTYANTAPHEDADDRVYNGGTITNACPPKTGDGARPILWLLTGLLALGLSLVAVHGLKKKNE